MRTVVSPCHVSSPRFWIIDGEILRVDGSLDECAIDGFAIDPLCCSRKQPVIHLLRRDCVDATKCGLRYFRTPTRDYGPIEAPDGLPMCKVCRAIAQRQAAKTTSA
jgi:hypothetical protein